MIEYAPIIADVIPGFVGNKVNIPFTMNPAVSKGEVSSFKLKILDYYTNKQIAGANYNINNDNNFPNDGIIRFIVMVGDAAWVPSVRQYYKFQIAYSDGNDDTAAALKYSNVSIGKCVGDNKEDFQIFIDGFGEDTSYYNLINYECTYKTSQISEPLYSYRYKLSYTEGDKEIILIDSGDILYDVVDCDKIQNNERVSEFNFILSNLNLIIGKEYNLQLFGTTINGYKLKSNDYTIVEPNVNWDEEPEIVLFQDEKAKENGYMNLSIKCKKGGEKQHYLLERIEKEGEYFTIKNFEFETTGPFIIDWVDKTVQQGKIYQYALRQQTTYSDKPCWSNRIISNPLFVDYEYIFLSDNDKQLRIKFDPKVSSFKDTILESKTDTIGSKYPFFFRNAQIKYKEIPISGLISYHMDEDFMTDEELNLNQEVTSAAAGTKGQGPSITYIPGRTIDLSAINVAAERKFKLKVMDWLNNGQPKLFRSPTEGTYMIRLMNVSLSPNDTLGRMLHNFSATGYECADHTPLSLVNLGFLDFDINKAKTDVPDITLGIRFELGASRLGWGREVIERSVEV